MDRLLRVNKNPDYFSGLPMQSAQAIARETVSEFENWLKALAAYNKDPSLFTGKPKMPHLPYNGRSHSDQNSAEMIDFVLDNLGGVAGISLFFPVKGKIIIFHRNGFVSCGFSCAA